MAHYGFQDFQVAQALLHDTSGGRNGEDEKEFPCSRVVSNLVTSEMSIILSDYIGRVGFCGPTRNQRCG